MTERIDHAAEAVKCYEYANSHSNLSDFDREQAMRQGAIHGTLALVEQQRVTNIIALAALAETGVEEGVSLAAYRALHSPDGEGGLAPWVQEELGLS